MRQRKLDEYLADFQRERRRLNRLLPEDPNALRFHGTSSRNLPMIDRYRAVLPPDVLRFRGEYVPRTSRGRYDPFSRDIRDKIVSLGDLRTALRYAYDDRLKGALSPERIRHLEENLYTLRFALGPLASAWPSTHDVSEWQEFLNLLRKGYHDYARIPHFPVVVAVPAFNAPRVKELDPHVRAEEGEQGVVAVPAQHALFFVPAKSMYTARKLAPRIAHRIFPLELLFEYFERKGKKVFDD